VAGEGFVETAGCGSEPAAGEDIVSAGFEAALLVVEQGGSGIEKLGRRAGGHVVKWPDLFTACGELLRDPPDGSVGAVCVTDAGNPSGGPEATDGAVDGGGGDTGDAGEGAQRGGDVAGSGALG